MRLFSYISKLISQKISENNCFEVSEIIATGEEIGVVQGVTLTSRE
jgi:hypothetical protein